MSLFPPTRLARATLVAAATGTLTLGLLSPVAYAADPPPMLTLTYLGPGGVASLSDTDIAVGARRETSGALTPLVSVQGAPFATLPLPTGATGGFTTDVSDAGVIVGNASFSSGLRAVRWTPSGTSYAVDVLPLPSGEMATYAAGINESGQIVGARAGLLGTPFGFGWLYSDAGGTVSLNTAYGWDTTPVDITDDGVILGSAETLTLSTGTRTSIQGPPPGYGLFSPRGINEVGHLVGEAVLSSQSLAQQSAFRYAPVPGLPSDGFQFIAGLVRNALGVDINDLGDVTVATAGTDGLFAGTVDLVGVGRFSPTDLLDPAATTAGWRLFGAQARINNSRVMTSSATNSLTGQSGAVLLRPAGPLPAPNPPTIFTATPVSAVPLRPWNSIDLAWSGRDPLTKSVEVQRRSAGTPDWATLSGATGSPYSDTAITTGATYDYRIRAIGLAGPGPWSATETVTAPTTVVDTTAPTLSFSGPAEGAVVSGKVTLSATAKDPTGILNLRIRVTDPQYPNGRVLVSSAATSVSAVWDTTRLIGPQTITVEAIDSWHNQSAIVRQVFVGSTSTVMHVDALTLSSRVRRGTVTVTGLATVTLADRVAVPGATVVGTLHLPDGTTVSQPFVTNTRGQVTFSWSGTQKGQFSLTIEGVTYPKLTFDPAASVLSRTITVT